MSEFWAEVEQLAAAYQEIGKLKAEIERAGRRARGRHARGGSHPKQVVLRALRERQAEARGGIVFRVSWWGFHLTWLTPC
ncbi:MAG TPA: hypothetical protein VK524_21015 [Polyangiaceae bacterium]|nr:hypothetical protein [Polyangiaceae bacterium]